MLEFEKKIILNKHEYEFLDSNFFNDAQIIHQTNYYYDTPKLELNEKNITARIRETDGKFVSMIKDHSDRQTDCSIETICNTSNEYDETYFRKLGLSCYGKLHTMRKIIIFSNIYFMLDKNEYLDVVDYELEIEYQVGFEKKAMQCIKQLSEVLKENVVVSCSEEFMRRLGTSESKTERFFKRL